MYSQMKFIVLSFFLFLFLTSFMNAEASHRKKREEVEVEEEGGGGRREAMEEEGEGGREAMDERNEGKEKRERDADKVACIKANTCEEMNDPKITACCVLTLENNLQGVCVNDCKLCNKQNPDWQQMKENFGAKDVTCLKIKKGGGSGSGGGSGGGGGGGGGGGSGGGGRAFSASLKLFVITSGSLAALAAL